MVTDVKNMVLWGVTCGSLVDRYQHFRAIFTFIFCLERSNTSLCNIGTYLLKYMASHPRRLQSCMELLFIIKTDFVKNGYDVKFGNTVLACMSYTQQVNNKVKQVKT
jgi:hypothetical protein